MKFDSSQRMDGIGSHGTSWDPLQVNAAGEWKEPEASGLSSGPHSTVRNRRDEEVPQKERKKITWKRAKRTSSQVKEVFEGNGENNAAIKNNAPVLLSG